jgi:hypothetical protein
MSIRWMKGARNVVQEAQLRIATYVEMDRALRLSLVCESWTISRRESFGQLRSLSSLIICKVSVRSRCKENVIVFA